MYPQRIVCLTEETTETLYLLGEQDRIVGISGFTVRRKFKPEKVNARAGWEKIPAVRDQQLFEVKSPLILQPGPAALSDGLAALQRIITAWVAQQ